LSHPAAQLGGSDAGAHTQSNTDKLLCGCGTLQHWVREREVLSLETAIAMLTARQADLFASVIGVGSRRAPTPTSCCSIPTTSGSTTCGYVQDMPAGGTRLVAEPVGIAASVVNGTTVTRAGELTGALPGTLAARGGRRSVKQGRRDQLFEHAVVVPGDLELLGAAEVELDVVLEGEPDPAETPAAPSR